jgi:hypothetical protein
LSSNDPGKQLSDQLEPEQIESTAPETFVERETFDIDKAFWCTVESIGQKAPQVYKPVVLHCFYPHLLSKEYQGSERSFTDANGTTWYSKSKEFATAVIDTSKIIDSNKELSHLQRLAMMARL